MAHDVFISYAAEDKQVADKVCEALEGHGVNCWIAPRDVPYGTDYEDAIVDAISASPILVLILSAHSNTSPHVKREIQNACAEGSTTRIIPLRIEDIPYSKGLQYYLRSTQWLDASTPPLEQHLRRLVEHVRTHLNREIGQSRASGPQPPPPPGDERPVAPPYRTAPPPPVAAEPRDTSGAQPARSAATRMGRTMLLVWLVFLLAFVVIVVVGYFISTPGGNSRSTEVNVQPSPAGVVVPNSPTPTPRHMPTLTPTPTPAPSPTPTPSPTPPLRNLNGVIPRDQNLRIRTHQPPP